MIKIPETRMKMTLVLFNYKMMIKRLSEIITVRKAELDLYHQLCQRTTWLLKLSQVALVHFLNKSSSFQEISMVTPNNYFHKKMKFTESVATNTSSMIQQYLNHKHQWFRIKPSAYQVFKNTSNMVNLKENMVR